MALHYNKAKELALPCTQDHVNIETHSPRCIGAHALAACAHTHILCMYQHRACPGGWFLKHLQQLPNSLRVVVSNSTQRLGFSSTAIHRPVLPRHQPCPTALQVLSRMPQVHPHTHPVFMCMCLYVYAMCVWVLRRPEVVSHLMWVLGTELGSFCTSST